MSVLQQILPQSTIEEGLGDVFYMRYSPDFKYLAVGCNDGGTRLYNLPSKKFLYGFDMKQPNGFPVTSIRFRPIQASQYPAILIVSADGFVRHWHLTTGKLMHIIKEQDNQVLALDYNAFGTQFATVGSDRCIRIYDESTKTVAYTLNNPESYQVHHSNRVFCLKFHPLQTNMLLSGGWDNTLQIWDLRTKAPARMIFGPHLCGDSLDVHEDEILTGSWRTGNQLQLWDFNSANLIHTYQFPAEEIKIIKQAEQPEALEKESPIKEGNDAPKLSKSASKEGLGTPKLSKSSSQPLVGIPKLQRSQSSILRTANVQPYYARFIEPQKTGGKSKTDKVYIVAGGSGSNESFVFDYTTRKPIQKYVSERELFTCDISDEQYAIGGADRSVLFLDFPQK
ncbi:MAG: putative 2,3-bisphosphoglycerate-dependent phosphoglycerate mutase [Streblomastix strix]|uniref:Putative 2,3-bisphosphoglycerate-dependent phosphoglycerate mutase n=1 Tax=Streblomastix strix TaxID=222440 RepID=A0A5J4X2H3_9EUKA|nr:MAG: putative 2,3-bisphosphoglycerate-dependent phosphoglycerate mutase [Streblomastix strix]